MRAYLLPGWDEGCFCIRNLLAFYHHEHQEILLINKDEQDKVETNTILCVIFFHRSNRRLTSLLLSNVLETLVDDFLYLLHYVVLSF